MPDQLRSHIEKILPLNDDEYELISSCFTYKKYKKHQFLVQEGQAVPYNYFVLKGLLKLVYTDEGGKEHIIGFAMED